MRPAGRRRWRSGRRDRSARSRRIRRTTLRPARVRAGRVRSSGAWRRRDRRVRRPTERPRRLTRCRARRIWAGRIWTRCVRAGRIRVGWVGPGRHRTVRMTARSVRLRVGVGPRVVRTGMVAMRIGRRYPATGLNWAARSPRTVHGGRGIWSGSAAVRSAAALLRDRGPAGTGRQRRLRASPGVLTTGRATLVLVVVGIGRRYPLPGHRRHAGPGRGGGAVAIVTLVVAHAASPRP